VATPAELQRAFAELNVLAARDLGRIWRALREGDNAGEALHDVLPALIDQYGAAAATVAAEWYDDLRNSLGIGGAFVAIPADVNDTGAHALIRWALDTASDDDTALALLEGGLQRRVINFGRFTVMESAIADPKADGWQRLGQGTNCAFCDMLISRGVVYSQRTAEFGAHDHDDCVAVPAFGGHPREVKPYTPSERDSTEADRARAREWIASH
jgi:hypothetical protein